MNIPPDFIDNIKFAFGIDGERYLDALPSLIEEASTRWQLAVGEPFLLSFNYVTAVTLPDGTPAVLKIGVPHREFTSEVEALRIYAGKGSARLIKSDTRKGFLLQERLLPGDMLAEMQDDDRATEIAAQVMQTLWRPVPEKSQLIGIEDWLRELGRYHSKYPGNDGPLPAKLVSLAREYKRELLSEDEPVVLLHGDCHHYNILKSGEAWKAIDPKGVIGPSGFEVGPLLSNPYPYFLERPDAGQQIKRRIAILSECLGMEPGLIRRWALTQSILSACWDLDELGQGGEYALECARLIIDAEN
ncbi:MAG: phosphotransferase [Anaerolineales bacterium]|nr:phosphotransferase [Anaerolineales bacterium]